MQKQTTERLKQLVEKFKQEDGCMFGIDRI